MRIVEMWGLQDSWCWNIYKTGQPTLWKPFRLGEAVLVSEQSRSSGVRTVERCSRINSRRSQWLLDEVRHQIITLGFRVVIRFTNLRHNLSRPGNNNSDTMAETYSRPSTLRDTMMINKTLVELQVLDHDVLYDPIVGLSNKKTKLG